MMKIDNNESPVCGMCKGKCCKNLPGALHPDDVVDCTKEGIRKLLERGDVSIDWYYSRYTKRFHRNRGYYLRFRTAHGPVIDPVYLVNDGRCLHLTENGCDLPFDERPYGCKSLVPKAESTQPLKLCCTSTYGSFQAAEAWEPYWKILDDLVEELS